MPEFRPDCAEILGPFSIMMTTISTLEMTSLVVFVCLFESSNPFTHYNNALFILGISHIGIGAFLMTYYIGNQSNFSSRATIFGYHIFLALSEMAFAHCSWTRGAPIVEITMKPYYKKAQLVYKALPFLLICQLVPEIVFLAEWNSLSSQSNLLDTLNLAAMLFVGNFLISFDIIFLLGYIQYLRGADESIWPRFGAAKKTKRKLDCAGSPQDNPSYGLDMGKMTIIARHGLATIVAAFISVVFFGIGFFQSNMYVYSICYCAYILGGNCILVIWLSLKFAIWKFRMDTNIQPSEQSAKQPNTRSARVSMPGMSQVTDA
ncbi:hypothetical protein HDU84_003528 [Entophlyctis sp. JEL0112]|nr:hypothetical protein HDU84_003528 [Entophlyctis sp. JEL0112]